MLLARHLRRSRALRRPIPRELCACMECKKNAGGLLGQGSPNGKSRSRFDPRDHLKTAPTIHMCNSRRCYIRILAERRREREKTRTNPFLLSALNTLIAAHTRQRIKKTS